MKRLATSVVACSSSRLAPGRAAALTSFRRFSSLTMRTRPMFRQCHSMPLTGLRYCSDKGSGENDIPPTGDGLVEDAPSPPDSATPSTADLRSQATKVVAAVSSPFTPQILSFRDDVADEPPTPRPPANIDDIVVDDGLFVTRLKADDGHTWVDVAPHPTLPFDGYQRAISKLLLQLGVHETLVDDTLESVLLPQCMITDGCSCIIMRCASDEISFDMDSIQELTNRLTVFIFPQCVITLHRADLPFLTKTKKKWESRYRKATKYHLLNLFVKEMSKSFQSILARSIVLFDEYESKLFLPHKQRSQLAKQIYHIKRRASVYSRILALTHDAYAQTAVSLKVPKYDVYFQDVGQHVAHVRSLSDELSDNAGAVLQLLFQLSSYQLNDLMRVLTLFSAFFIPLSFIAGVFGMNFDYMPGMHHEHGHLYCAWFMAFVASSLLMWFRFKGFL